MPHALLVPALLAPLALAPTSQDDEMGWTGVLDEEAFAALHELKAGETPDLRGKDMDVGDMVAYLSWPEVGEPVGAVVVIHEWWGLNDHVRHWADRLASDGYAALAVDLYGGTVATTREEAMEAMRSVDEDEALERLRAAHEYLADDEGLGIERTACIGWCFGGGWSLRLAMAEPDLDAAVVYYGRLVTDVDRLEAIEAPLLGVFGNEDRGIPPSSVDAFAAAMRSAGKELELRRYDAQHAFANPSSARYDAGSAEAAWRETRAFLCEHLSPEQADGAVHDGSRALEVDVPDGWEDQGERTMRIVSYEAAANTECYVSAFPGDVGGVLANVNRWRAQLGEDALDEEELEELPRIPMLGRLVPSLRVDGRYESRTGEVVADAALLGAICVRDEEVVFVKMIGPRPEVDDQAAAFVAFCRGLR